VRNLAWIRSPERTVSYLKANPFSSPETSSSNCPTLFRSLAFHVRSRNCPDAATVDVSMTGVWPAVCV
jgi:hypothetical protein